MDSGEQPSAPTQAAVPGAWYVACLAGDLRRRPLARTVCGTPVALFRGAAGRPVALLDRCPHRNVPLSYGRVRDGLIECCYHGWRFDGDGACRAVPGLVGEVDRRARRAPSFPTVESDGFVWIQLEEGADQRPYRLPHVHDPAYATVRRHVRFDSGLHAALENTLDVPHTAVRAALTPIANRILSQDAAVLRRQTESIRRFGGEQFASTELDVLGQHIRKLLRQAERGEPADATAGRRIKMRV